MPQASYESIAENPKFEELVRTRSRFAWSLSILMLLVYQGFILLVAFDPAFLAQRLFPDGVMTVGIPIGVGVIVFAFLLTGIYVVRANGRFDELNNELIKEITK